MPFRPAPSVIAIALLSGVACSRKAPPASDAGAPAVSEAGGPAPAASASATVPAATDIMSGASSSWDGGGAVVTEGSVDGAALRTRNRARIAADRSLVTMLQGASPRELGERLCTSVVPARAKETPILIKPNLGGFEWFKDPKKSGGDDGVRGRITDPEFVRGIVRCLKGRGHTKITVAEGWGAKHADWERLVEVSGYQAMTREEGVRLVAMDDDGVFDVEGDKPGKPLAIRGMEGTHSPTLLMPKVLAEHLEHGLFISAPKVKAHRFGVTSMAIKGGQGVVMLSDASPAFHQKWRMHKELGKALDLIPKDAEAGKKAYLDALTVFAERMSDVLEVAAPDVVLAEGAPAMGGDGFGKRWPTAENVAIGGTNPILVDRVGAAFLGLWANADLARELGGHPTSPLLETAAKRFGVDIANPEVTGDGATLLAEKRPVHFVSMSGFQLHSEGNEDTRPVLHAIAVDEGLTQRNMDGIANESWGEAVSFDTDWSGASTKIRTNVRAAYSRKGLYFLWELDDAGMNVDESRPIGEEREKLYDEDCVEVFLGRDATDRSRYFEIEVGPLGHFLDLTVDRKTKKSDVAWSSGLEVKTRVDRERHTVTIEMALRAPEILPLLTKRTTLPLALYRMEGRADGTSKRRYLAWSPTRTPKPNFHVPEAFGTISFE